MLLLLPLVKHNEHPLIPQISFPCFPLHHQWSSWYCLWPRVPSIATESLLNEAFWTQQYQECELVWKLKLNLWYFDWSFFLIPQAFYAYSMLLQFFVTLFSIHIAFQRLEGQMCLDLSSPNNCKSHAYTYLPGFPWVEEVLLAEKVLLLLASFLQHQNICSHQLLELQEHLYQKMK